MLLLLVVHPEHAAGEGIAAEGLRHQRVEAQRGGHNALGLQEFGTTIDLDRHALRLLAVFAAQLAIVVASVARVRARVLVAHVGEEQLARMLLIHHGQFARLAVDGRLQEPVHLGLWVALEVTKHGALRVELDLLVQWTAVLQLGWDCVRGKQSRISMNRTNNKKTLTQDIDLDGGRLRHARRVGGRALEGDAVEVAGRLLDHQHVALDLVEAGGDVLVARLPDRLRLGVALHIAVDVDRLVLVHGHTVRVGYVDRNFGFD